ncbi:MAG: hypothetical protein AB7G25_10495, partial [Sphingomonadaceae bacterium]
PCSRLRHGNQRISPPETGTHIHSRAFTSPPCRNQTVLRGVQLIRAIGFYTSASWHDLPNKNAVTFEMHRDKVITETWLSRYLLRRAAFRDKDATRALKKAIDNLLNGDEIIEIGKRQMQQQYARGARAFCIKVGDRFVEAIMRMKP